MKKHCGQSGQATIELAAILVGLVAVMLGMIFVAGLCMGNNRTLLDSKVSSETLSRSGNGNGTVGNAEDPYEYNRWTYTTLNSPVNSGWSKVSTGDSSQTFTLNSNYKFYRIYDPNKMNANSERLTIPFLAGDQLSTTNQDSIGRISPEMIDANSSTGTNYYYAWYRPSYFDIGLSDSEMVSISNSLVAADLASSTVDNTETMLDGMTSGYKDNASSKMYNAFYKWFGVKVAPSQLKKIPSNSTYMPNL